MRVNLTPQQICVQIEDVKFHFHNVNSLTAHECSQALLKNNTAGVFAMLQKYLREVEGVQDANGKALGKDDMQRLPAELLYDALTEFIKDCKDVSNQIIREPMGAEEKNAETP